ncbi:MAG: hypothetical protein ACRDMV_01065 [Streptosporangiales bacterium]
MTQKMFTAQVKAAGDDDGEFEVVLSTSGLDRDHERFAPYALQPLPEHINFDIDHRMSVEKIVGSGVPRYEQDGKAIVVRGKFASTPLAQMVRTLVTEGHVRTTSVAAMITDEGPDEDDGVWTLRGGELLNGAFAAIPTNPDAVVLAAKSLQVKGPIGSHSTATDEGAWNASANVGHIGGDASAATLRREYAWVDPDGDAEAKSSYKFPHHFVSDNGTVGAASTRACSAGIAVLNGSRGGADIPADDRRGVYGHLARHLRDADTEPPELKSFDDPQTIGADGVEDEAPTAADESADPAATAAGSAEESAADDGMPDEKELAAQAAVFRARSQRMTG